MAGSGGRSVQRPNQTMTNEQINGYLRNRLREYNRRDTKATDRHIRGLRSILESGGNHALPTRFGGSVTRHTYVDGLSDVDLLLTINDSSLSGQSPKVVIRKMADLIQRHLQRNKVRTGNLAVSVGYADGHELQVLPAIRARAGVRIADPSQNQWSQIIHPERFAETLTKVNQDRNGQVIPAIKLTKALAHHFIRSDADKISGYHIESLAIEAFRNYQGPTDLKSMVHRLTDYAEKAVLQPIKDPTRQSRYVDDYMGAQNSNARQKAAANFRKMRDGLDRCASKADLDNLFDD